MTKTCDVLFKGGVRNTYAYFYDDVDLSKGDWVVVKVRGEYELAKVDKADSKNPHATKWIVQRVNPFWHDMREKKDE